MVLYEIQPVRPVDIARAWRKLQVVGSALLVRVSAIASDLASLPSSPERLQRLLRIVKFLASVAAWWFGLFVVSRAFPGPGPVTLAFSVSVIAAIFLFGLRQRQLGDTSLSAYSVFNDGFQNLMGTLTAEELEAQMFHRR